MTGHCWPLLKSSPAAQWGIDDLVAAISENNGIIEVVYELRLLMMGHIKRTSSGRVAAELAYPHLKRSCETSDEKSNQKKVY